MKPRQIILLAALTLSACVVPTIGTHTSPKPPAPAIHTIVVHVCAGDCALDQKLRAATVSIAETGFSGSVDGAGNLVIPGLVHGVLVNVCAVQDGYASACVPVTPVTDTPDINVSLTALEPPLPPVPSRDELLHAHETFQGLTCAMQQYGTLPLFDPYIAAFQDPADRAACYAVKVAAGDTTVILGISGQYAEPGQAYATIPGVDLSQDLGTLRARIIEALTVGHLHSVRLMLAGDGLSAPQNPDGSFPYNDPVGHTYGFQWLLANFPRIYDALAGRHGEGPDLTPYIVFFAGFDGWIPGWAGPENNTTRVGQWLTFARGIVGPQGALGVYLSAGYWAWTGEHNDYATPEGQNVDFVSVELPYPMGPPDSPVPADFCNAGNEARAPFDQVWQVSKRLLGPLYVHPADQPACDDPGLAPALPMTPRGPIVVEATEYDIYGGVRGLSPAVTARRRAYLRALGYPLVG